MTALEPEMVDRVAQGIARSYLDVSNLVHPLSEEDWATEWREMAPPRRERFLQQAEAALLASGLLSRIKDLDRKIQEARAELETVSASPSFNVWRSRDRARRILAAPPRREQPARYQTRHRI